MRSRMGIGGALALACLSVGGVALAVSEQGSKRNDRLVGSKARDTLKGRAGHDTLKGLRGRDTLVGGAGEDVLIGGKGPDVLRGGRGRDSFNMRAGVQLAAPGRDKIHARDGGQDEINCGAGEDVAIVDAFEDGVYDCEVIREP